MKPKYHQQCPGSLHPSARRTFSLVYSTLQLFVYTNIVLIGLAPGTCWLVFISLEIHVVGGNINDVSSYVFIVHAGSATALETYLEQEL